ncbi:MAG: hypothetical protein ACAH83_15955 [Alphaproteobacteria bacterium]
MAFHHDDYAAAANGQPARLPAASSELREAIETSRKLRADLRMTIAASRERRVSIAQQRPPQAPPIL